MSASPDRVAISAAFRRPAGMVGDIAAHALQAIDRVHADGALPIIPIQKSRAKKRYAAMYQSITGEGHDGKDRAIRIFCSVANDSPALALCHEIGHFLDDYGWAQFCARSDHWTDADFAPILEAMDDIFRERVWLHE